MKKTYLASLILSLYAASSWAIQPFVVKDIRVEGIQRTEAGTVFSYLPVKVGETMDDEKAAAAIKALYATGFFKDVRLDVQNDVLIVLIEERPAITQIDISGNKDIDKDQLRKGLKDIGLAESRIYDKALLDRAEQEIKRLYISRGRYAAEIVTTVTPLERNRVAINFAIVEGDVSKIKQINFVGNKVFSESKLSKLFTLTTPGWFTWLSKNDQYSKEKLSGDLEKMRSFYLNQGYLEFTIDSTQVSISPDKKDIYLTINITEGPKYTISDVKLAGDTLVPEDELRKLIKVKAGDVFSREKLTESTKNISDRLGNDGYAFANVNAVPELNKEKQQVAFTFFVDPGRRVYVRHVNVTGNNRTRDEVIRREMRQIEGGWYSVEKINRSKERVDKLGFFSEVNVETPAVQGTTDQVDVNVNVAEKPTGNITLGAGFSSSEGVIFSGAVSQNNVLGSGNALSAQFNTGRVNKVISISYTNPYYTVDGISRGFDLYQRNVDPSSLSVGNYRTSTLGGGVRYGVPVTETDAVNFGLGVEHTKVDVFSDSPQRFIDFVNQFGNKSTTLLGSLGWARDTRDSVLYPTKGRYQRAGLESGLPGGDLQYYKMSFQQQWFYPLSSEFVLMLNGEVGFAGGLRGKPLPFFKNFYAGGNTSVRGYDTASLGPRDNNGEALGGKRRYVGNAEIFFPFPGMQNDKSVRMSTFFDIGKITGDGQQQQYESFRSSAGLAVTWISFLGPLKFSYAKPLNSKDGDKIQKFQFTLGSTF